VSGGNGVYGTPGSITASTGGVANTGGGGGGGQPGGAGGGGSGVVILKYTLDIKNA
jgi:hypothetical protein